MEGDILTLPALHTVLGHAIATNIETVQSATRQLHYWQSQSGFYKLLQDCISDQNLPFEARWLAAIQMKNGIDRFWRKTALNALSPEEKKVVRSRCIGIGISEPDHRLALQNALFVAKIARIDYPHDWPEAVQDILRTTEGFISQEASLAKLSASLLLLLTLIKELSTARLMRTRRSFHAEGPAVLDTVSRTYLKVFTSWQQEAVVDSALDTEITIQHMKCNLLCLRILRRVLVGAFEHPVRDQRVHEVWDLLSQHFEQLVKFNFHRGRDLSIEARVIVQKMIIQLSKLHVSMIEDHPSSFPQLPKAVAIAKSHWDVLKQFGSSFGVHSLDLIAAGGPSYQEGEFDEHSFQESLSLKGLLLLRGCVKMVYQPVPTLKYQTSEDKQDKSMSKQAMKDTILSDDLVRQMMEIIVTKFFVFRDTDLRRWTADPVEWERQEEGGNDAWKYSVRLCSEKLFLDLVLNHKQLLTDPLLDAFSNVADLRNKDILLKDSIYSAVGLSAPILIGKLDFNSFMRSTLLPELQSHEVGFSILRRRAAILIAQWSAVGGIDMDATYQVFLHLLDKSQALNDIVVRLTAGRQLKFPIDSYEANARALLPYAASLLKQLMDLIVEAEPTETKIALIGTVQSFVLLMEEEISPYANEIVSRLPQIWDQADDEYLLKQVVIGLLSELFKAMKAESSRLHSLTLPLISSALDDENEARLYLLDDTVDLWASVLAQSPEPSRDVLALWTNLLPLFDTADENFRRALEIMDSYILLFPNEILRDGLADFWQAISKPMTQALHRHARVSVCELAERLLVVAQRIGGLDTFRKVTLAPEASCFLFSILEGLLSAFRSHQDPSPNRPKTDINGIIETQYWRIIARIMISDSSILFELIQKVIVQEGHSSTEQVFGDLLTELFAHYDDLCSPTASKLIALALTALFSSGDAGLDQFVTSRLQEVITIWIAAIHECTYEERDTLIWVDANKLKPEGSESPEQARRCELEMGDPIRRENLRHIVAATIQSFSTRSPIIFQESLENVDTDVMAQFKDLKLF